MYSKLRFAAYLVLFFVFFLISSTGCTKFQEPDWSNAPQTHTCTADQMVKVEKETVFCKGNTSYISTYCYGSAIMRNCTKKVQ